MFFHADEEQKIKKTEKDYKELLIKLESEQAHFCQNVEKSQIDTETLEEYLFNSANFTPVEWEYIQNKWHELDTKEKKYREGTIDPRKTNRQVVGSNWLYCK